MTSFTFFKLAGGCGASNFSSGNAFDRALHAAGIWDRNLVKLSSIIPPGCREMAVSVSNRPGEILYAAYSVAELELDGYIDPAIQRGGFIVAGIGISRCIDRELPGVIMETSFSTGLRDPQDAVRLCVQNLNDSCRQAMRDRRRNMEEFLTHVELMSREDMRKRFNCAFAACLLI